MRTWFITGASRGFGALIAQRALAAGDTVVATARKPADVTARLGLGAHEHLLALPLDVTQEAQARQAVDSAVARVHRREDSVVIAITFIPARPRALFQSFPSQQA